jgi:hypothetical protein
MGLQRRKFLAAAARLAAAGFLVPAHLVRAVETGKEFKSSDELYDAYTSGKSNGIGDGHNVLAGDYDSSDALLKAYAEGAEGSVFEPGRLDKVLAGLKHGRFCEAAPGLVGSGKGKISLPFKNVLYFDPLYYHLAQSTLDCTSFGTCGACDGSRATEIIDGKEPEEWIVRGATEAIYGARNSSRGGMDPARAAQWVHDEGGLLLRQKYGNIDLTTYNGSVGARWGGTGIPREILQAAAEHRVGEIALITSVSEARDALANGYFLSCGSGYGFTRTRDKKGFCRRSKGWNHCMHWTACDDYTFGECAFLVQNSWGDYVDGGSPEWGELPISSFLVHEEDAAGMIAQRGMWAFSMVNGWPARELKKFGTSDYAWRTVRMLFNALI